MESPSRAGTLPPPPPSAATSPHPGLKANWLPSDSSTCGGHDTSRAEAGKWKVVTARAGVPPCQRSLHAAAVWTNALYIFGGYDGTQRINDLHCFNFTTQQWTRLSTDADPASPSPRDRHVACVHGNGFYVFGGFDGLTRVNDMHCFDLERLCWTTAGGAGGHVPSPRHSHSAVVYGDSLFVFGGYDGSYRNDFHEFDFRTQVWSPVKSTGKVPRARYRGTCVVHGHEMVLHGGHDGNKHLQDTYVFNFNTRVWSEVETSGDTPSARDSHVAVAHRSSMYIFGGSTGSAVGDFHQLDLDCFVWSRVNCARHLEGGMQRFCHVGAMYSGALWVFGGFEGSNRLNDFHSFEFCAVEEDSTIIADLKRFVNNELLSDITFVVENRRVYAHKLLCLRCPYFYNMLTGEYMESRASELLVEDVRYDIFLLLLEFLYSDRVDVTLDVAMELFQAADRFGVDRLKKRCEEVMQRAISIDTAAHILLAADVHNAEVLRERCMRYILTHFDAVSVSAGFEEMSRASLDLNLEVIRRRIHSSQQ